MARECRATNILTRPNDSAPDSARRGFGFELGPQFSLPFPSEGASRDESGLDVGLSFTGKPDQYVGIGIGAAYHYWPVSDEFKGTFSDLLRRGTFNTLELGGDGWRLNVRQITAHVKFTALPNRVVRPWLQVGVGLYQVDSNISGFSGNAGFFTVSAPPFKPTSHRGYYATTGVDVRTGGGTRLGVDATYHRVMCRDEYGSELGILTVGCHALFGR